PQIVSFDSIEITGNSTVDMPLVPTDDNIANVGFVKATIGGARNIGDIFYTMRKDSAMNGAVECNGGTYSTEDFDGAASIGNLLALNKIPYVSLSTYQTLLNTQGSVGVFGWDGVGTTAFRVPSLEDIFVESGTSAEIGDYLAPKIPNIKASFVGGISIADGAMYTDGTVASSAAESGGSTDTRVRLDASRASGVYDDTATTVQPNAVRYRAMVQLAVSATDEAVITCTGVLADVAGLKTHEVIEFQAPTALNNYTWYRKYADGWVEQGGIVSSSENGSYVVNLPVTMADTNYGIQMVSNYDPNGSLVMYANVTTTYFERTSTNNSGTLAPRETRWEVKGMAA
ncbi:MAG: hypothetical protein J6R83_02705, partial [Clostridia bacterium]|nr:hypothetical protein [Clostridia bacterium]